VDHIESCTGSNTSEDWVPYLNVTVCHTSNTFLQSHIDPSSSIPKGIA